MVQRLTLGLLFAACLALLLWSGSTLSQAMVERPFTSKLGYTPPATVLKVASGEHRQTLAELVALKVMLYFGSLAEGWKHQVVLPPEYYNMYQTLESALRLDPYNADIYYFTQAVFTWDAGRAREVNRFLDYGIKHRTWDPMLPFFAGFNAAYFLKDYTTAADYMQKAAEIANNPSMARLASRYFYESGRTEMAVNFLEQMIRSAPSRQEAELYQMRRDALVAVNELQTALSLFTERFERKPANLHELIGIGNLKKMPVDPYGGTFYLDDEGRVRSTSKLAKRTDATQ